MIAERGKLPEAFYDRLLGINEGFRRVVLRKHALAPTKQIRDAIYLDACTAFMVSTINMRRENIDAIERMIGEALR